MAKQVSDEAVDFKIASGRYASQWLQWLDGNIWELVPGQDFTCSVRAFKAHCYYIARTYGTRIRTKVQDGLFYLQVNPPVVDPQPMEPSDPGPTP